MPSHGPVPPPLDQRASFWVHRKKPTAGIGVLVLFCSEASKRQLTVHNPDEACLVFGAINHTLLQTKVV